MFKVLPLPVSMKNATLGRAAILVPPCAIVHMCSDTYSTTCMSILFIYYFRKFHNISIFHGRYVLFCSVVKYKI